MKRTADQFLELLGKLPSTNATIVVGLYLAAVFVHVTLLADLLQRPISDGTQTTIGFFISAMLGVGVAQFNVKRRTDDAYIAAKNGHGPAMRATQELPLPGGTP